MRGVGFEAVSPTIGIESTVPGSRRREQALDGGLDVLQDAIAGVDVSSRFAIHRRGSVKEVGDGRGRVIVAQFCSVDLLDFLSEHGL